jgi:hypothetical protein
MLEDPLEICAAALEWLRAQEILPLVDRTAARNGYLERLRSIESRAHYHAEAALFGDWNRAWM